MAYTINGKVYTSHPLMDEVVHACKTILDGIVLKNEKLANNYETADSLTESDAFLAIMNNSIHLEILPISEKFLIDHGFSNQDAINISRDINSLPDYAECTLKRYNEADVRTVYWNYNYARYEFTHSGIAGMNINTPVYLQDGRFVYSDGSVCTGNVIALKANYFIDGKGNIVLQDENDPDVFYNLDGSIYYAKPTECLAGIIREYANDYRRYEQNLYYRTINGMPPYGTNNFDVYVDYESYQYLLDLDDDNSEFNFDIPIHEFNDIQITTLSTLGILDDIVNTYYNNAEEINKPYYKYLTHLGTNKIDLYQARVAKEWDILYMPPVEHIIGDRFKEAYKINRDIYYRRTYQQAYSLYSDYYEEIVMILILCQTFTDLIVEVPEFYIRRDVFDLRTAQYFLEANGVAFYKEIPLKYQVLLIKNLNKLIKYKSTERNINDILDIFSMSDSMIYKFYLFKKYLYNIYEEDIQTDTGDDIDSTGWEATDFIKNGDFETGDLTNWTVSANPPTLECGYRITREPISAYNTSPYLLFYDKGTNEYDLSISQELANIPIGKYRIRARISGTKNRNNGMRFYLNGIAVMGTKTTYGESWIDIVSSPFDLEAVTTLNFEFKGEIPSYYDGKIDNIVLEEYNEIFDCGDEDEEEGFLVPTEELDFFDEDSTDEYPTQMYLYDFGNEDAGTINPGDKSDAEEDYNESQRLIYDEVGNVYDLEFVKVPLGEGYDDYIKDSIYRQQYDSVVRQDKYWNGEDTHNYIKNLHLQKDFTIEGSKFMGLEFNIPFQEYAYQKQYYLSMYMNADINTNDIKISVPSIKQNTQFLLKNIITFIYCCNGLYDDGHPTPVVDTTSKFIAYKEKEEFKPYTVIDGGHPWDEDTGEEPIPEEDEEWDVPDLDFGDEDDPNFVFVKDQFLQIFDFGFHNVIDYSDPELEVYDYGDETEHELTPEEEEAEETEPPIWPFQDLCDFGCEDLSAEENINGDISVPVVRTDSTKEYDFVDEDEWVDPDLPVDPIDYIYDFNAKTAGTVDYIESVSQNSSILECGDEDEEVTENTKLYGITELYDFQDETNYTPVNNKDYVFDFSEITPDSDDSLDYNEVPEDYYQPYYVQNDKGTVFQLYEYNPTYEAYTLVKDYSTDSPDEPWEYDIKDVITEFNYVTYLGHYAIDMNTGEYTKITKDNYTDYLGLIVRMRFPWYNTPPGKYTKVIDGHHNMQDEDRDDVKYIYSQSKYVKLNGEPANGEITLINDKYKYMVDGGKTIYTLDQTKMAYYDWLRFEYPNKWLPLTGRVYGFNMNADLNQLSIDIGERHSIFGWQRGYTLEECGVASFIVKTKISDLNDMYTIYETNTQCYYNIIEKMEDASTRDERQVLDYLYYSLFTRPFDQDTYILKTGDLATTYEQILAEKDYTLYNYYLQIKSEEDPEVRKEILRDILNNLVDTLSYYISGDNLKYVLTFVSTNSTDAVLSYMMQIINFFKSWTVYFLEPHNTYIVNDKYNHMVYSGDTITELKVSDWHTDTFAPRDSIVIDVKYEVLEENKRLAFDGTPTSNTHKGAQVVDVANHYTDENITKEKVIEGNVNETIPYDSIEGDVPEDRPYYIVDGGRVDARHSTKVLDGGGAGLLSKDDYITGLEENPSRIYINLPRPTDEDKCVVIDGNEEWEEDNQTYTVDGGPASARTSVTPTTVTSVTKDNRIVVDARISPVSDNAIEIVDDGLLVDKNELTEVIYTSTTKGTITDQKNKIVEEVTPLLKSIEISGDINNLQSYIFGVFSNYFDNPEHVISKLKDDTYINEVSEKAEVNSDQIRSWFSINNPLPGIFQKVE